MNVKKRFKMNSRQRAELKAARKGGPESARRYIVRNFFRGVGFQILNFSVRAGLLFVCGRAMDTAPVQMPKEVVKSFFGTQCIPFGEPQGEADAKAICAGFKKQGMKAYKSKNKDTGTFQVWVEKK